MPKNGRAGAWRMPSHRRMTKLFRSFHEIADTGYAMAEGVEIDLRDPAIPAENWHSPEVSVWGIPGNPWHETAFVFPWHSIEGLSANNRDIFVEAGDRISVARVETLRTGDELEHEADREIRQVYLLLTRRDGTPPSVMEDSPIPFYRYGSFLAERGNRVSFQNIARRISEANGVRGIFDICLWTGPSNDDDSEGRPLEFEETLLNRAQMLAIERHAIIASIEGQRTKFSQFAQTTRGSWPGYRERHKLSAFDVEKAFDSAIALGFLWSKFEDGKARGFAEKALRSRIGSRTSGQIRGTQKKLEAEETRNLILPVACRIRADTPNISQSALASEIKFKLDEQVPDARTLELHIRALERSGALPKRIKQ